MSQCLYQLVACVVSQPCSKSHYFSRAPLWYGAWTSCVILKKWNKTLQPSNCMSDGFILVQFLVFIHSRIPASWFSARRCKKKAEIRSSWPFVHVKRFGRGPIVKLHVDFHGKLASRLCHGFFVSYVWIAHVPFILSQFHSSAVNDLSGICVVFPYCTACPCHVSAGNQKRRGTSSDANFVWIWHRRPTTV